MRRFQDGGLNALEDETDDGGTPTSDVTASGGLTALDVPGAAEALKAMAKSSAEARKALMQAREQIAARKYNRAIALFAVSGALGAPTRSGSSAEGWANAANAMVGPLREKQEFERQQSKDILGIDTDVAGLDEKTAMAQLQLAMLRAKLNADAAKAPNDVVQNPDGTYSYKSHADARKPGVLAPPPASQKEHFTYAQMTLPDGTAVPIRFNNESGQAERIGDPYRPRLAGNAATQALSKLQTTQVLKAQMQDVRDAWAGIKDSYSAGYLQGWVPTEAGKLFDKAVDMMRGTIRQITRVPGEGSMSDWEGKLDQAKLPNRGEYESVTEKSFDQLDKLIGAYETATRDMLGMTGQAAPGGGGAAPPKMPPLAPPAPTAPRVAPRTHVPNMKLTPAEQKELDEANARPEVPTADDLAPARAPPEALAYLKAHPETRETFKATFKYLPDGY